MPLGHTPMFGTTNCVSLPFISVTCTVVSSLHEGAGGMQEQHTMLTVITSIGAFR